MSAGLQVFNGDGSLLLDTSHYIGRLLGVIDCNSASGSAYVTGLDQGIPFAVPMIQMTTAYNYGTNSYPDCSFSGNTVFWTRQTAAALSLPPCKLILGVR
jgi:hypothetical protein